MPLQTNPASILALLPYLQRSSGALGSYLGQKSTLGQTLQSPNMLSGLGGVLGSAFGGKYAPWAAGAGSLGGNVLGSLLSNKPISTTGIGGGLGGMLGSYIGGKQGRLGSAIGSGLGNVGGQFLTGALFPSTATGLAGGLGSGVSGLLTGLLGSLFKGEAAQGYNVASPVISMLANQYLTPAITSGISSLLGTAAPVAAAGGTAPAVAGAAEGIAPAAGALSSVLGYAAPVAMVASWIYNIWSDYKAHKKQVEASREYNTQFNKVLTDAYPQFEPLVGDIQAEGAKRLDYAKTSGKTAQELGIDPNSGLTNNEMMGLYGGNPSIPSLMESYNASWLGDPYRMYSHDWSKHYVEAPFTYGAERLMTTAGLDYSKILPWLSATTQGIDLPSGVDPNTYPRAKAQPSPIGQDLITSKFEQLQQQENERAKQAYLQSTWGGM